MAVLSQCIRTGGIGLPKNGILDNKSHSQPASSLDKANAMSLASMVDFVITCYFLDLQHMALPPKIKI